jgi:hypothetical protein
MVTKKLKNTTDEEQKDGLERAQTDEIKLLFQDLEAREPVKKEVIPKGYQAHNTHLFTVETCTADGKH